MTHLLVLPSPFLGTAAYEPLAAALEARGGTAGVATYEDPPVATRLVEQWADQAATLAEVALVAHSNAGYLAPAVSGRLGGTPIVFLDAALPVTGEWTHLAPDRLRDQLARLAGEDGLLPPWSRWWPREELSAVAPDPVLEHLDTAAPRVPLTYVDGKAPVPAGWEASPCAYLGFGSQTYAVELGRARSLSWPIRVLEGAGHLHVLVAPDETAGAVVDLLGSLPR